MSKCPNCGYKATKKVSFLGSSVIMACPRCETILSSNPRLGRAIVLLGNIGIVGAVVGIYIATQSVLWTTISIGIGYILSVLSPFFAGGSHRWEAIKSAKAVWRTRESENHARCACPYCHEQISFREYMNSMAGSPKICPRCFTYLTDDWATRRNWRELVVWAVYAVCALYIASMILTLASSQTWAILIVTTFYILSSAYELARLAVRYRYTVFQIPMNSLSEQEFETQVLAELRERQAELRK